MQISIPFSEYKALSQQHDHDRPVLVSLELLEQDDPFPSASELETEFDDQAQTIIRSDRFSNEDVAKFGWKKVRSWIEQDHARLKQFGNTWWKVGIMAKAVIVIPASRGTHFFR